MRQAERPETQVRRGVGDTTQAILYGVYGLVNHDFSEIKLLTNKNGVKSSNKRSHYSSMQRMYMYVHVHEGLHTVHVYYMIVHLTVT